jgi:hypothetical protein
MVKLQANISLDESKAKDRLCNMLDVYVTIDMSIICHSNLFSKPILVCIVTYGGKQIWD